MKPLLTILIVLFSMQIMLSQNIGISEDNPEEKLHVNGNVKFDYLIQNSNNIQYPEVLAYGKVNVNADTFVIQSEGSNNWIIKTVADSFYCQDVEEFVDFSRGEISLVGQNINDDTSIFIHNQTSLSGYTIRPYIVNGKVIIYAVFEGLGCPLVGKVPFVFQISTWPE